MELVKELVGFEESNRWLDAHAAVLVKKYPHQYIAVSRQQVIAHDRQLKRLLNRIGKEYPAERSTIAIKYLSPKKIELILCGS